MQHTASSNKKRLVVLTGAGISAESGLKTFRDSDGLWEGYDINEVATATAWRKNPALVQEFYNMRRRQVRAAQPNKGHRILAELEKDFDVHIITQNIDDLHEKAGSTRVIHLHGEILKMRSVNDEEKIFPVDGDIEMGDLAEDGGQLRPHIVWFEEAVPMMDQATRIMKQAEIFLIVGTSLVVYPAAGLVHYTPPGIPIYIVDKKIPYLQYTHQITAIEKGAGEGLEEFMLMLNQI